jgi:hypothetical protein
MVSRSFVASDICFWFLFTCTGGIYIASPFKEENVTIDYLLPPKSSFLMTQVVDVVLSPDGKHIYALMLDRFIVTLNVP